MLLMWLLFQTPESSNGPTMWERILVPIASAAVATLLTYLATRPKTQADINKTDADARKVEEQIVRDTREDLKTWVARWSELADESRKLEDEFDEVRRHFRDFREDVTGFFERVEEALADCGDFPNILKDIQRLRMRYQLTGPGVDIDIHGTGAGSDRKNVQ